MIIYKGSVKCIEEQICFLSFTLVLEVLSYAMIVYAFEF